MTSAIATDNVMDTFFWSLRDANEKALLLNYDGTLARFHAEQHVAPPYLGIAEFLLASIMGRTQTRVVLITGRPAQELRSLLALDPSPEIWGSHGLERLRGDGTYEIAQIPEEAQQTLAAMDRCLVASGLERFLERKAGGLAVQWRDLATSFVEETRVRVLRLWNNLGESPLLAVSQYDDGMEFRLNTRSKGDAVRELLDEMPTNTAVAYLGGDIGDEGAFFELHGRGLTVLVCEQYRATAAAEWIHPPDGLLKFFERWLDTCEQSVKV